MNKDQAINIVEEIHSLSHNIKAEVIVANLLRLGCSTSDILINYDGSFGRPYRNDILKSTISENEYDDFELNLNLTRNGIYDLLPEGFTHKQDASSVSKSAKTFAADYRRRKRETSMARNFFKPLENEIFHQLVSLEKKEQDLLYDAKSSFYKFIIDFWQIKRMKQPYEGYLVRLMPYIHSFAGNYQFLCVYLEKTLNVPVSYKVQHRTIKVATPKEGNKNLKLGQNFTAGTFVYGVPCIIFTIGSVPYKRIKEFLEGGSVYIFLQEFYKFTIPFEIDVESKIISDRFTCTENEPGYGVLGYSAGL